MLSKVEFRAGINKDDSGLAVEGGWIDADKVRFRQGRAQTVGGWGRITATPVTGICRALHAWAGHDGATRVALGTHLALWVYTGGTLYDITPAALAGGLSSGGGGGFGSGLFGAGPFGITPGGGGTTAPRTWSLASWGENLLASPNGGTLYEWALNTAADALAVTGAPAKIGSMFVTSERIVVCCGATEFGGAVYDPMLVRWSGQEDNTDWSPSAADQSGEFPLSSGSRIVRGIPSRKTNLIWTDTSLYSMTYLGDPLLVYGFELLGQNCGLCGPNGAIEKDGAGYWFTRSGEFYSFTGGAAVPLVCPVQRYVADNLDWTQIDKVFAATNSSNQEIWWFYPDVRDGTGECSRYVIFNYAENHWSIGTWDRTAWTDAGALQYPIATDAAGYLYHHEVGHSADGGVLTAFLESAPSDLGDGDTLLSVLRIVPDIEDLSGGLDLSFKSRRFPAGSETVHGPYTVLPDTEKIDMRLTARQMALRIDSASAPSFWRLGAMRVDIRPTGSKR